MSSPNFRCPRRAALLKEPTTEKCVLSVVFGLSKTRSPGIFRFGDGPWRPIATATGAGAHILGQGVNLTSVPWTGGREQLRRRHVRMSCNCNSILTRRSLNGTSTPERAPTGKNQSFRTARSHRKPLKRLIVPRTRSSDFHHYYWRRRLAATQVYK